VQIAGNNTGAVGGSANLLAPGTLDLGGFDQAINGLDSTTGGFVTSNPVAGVSSSTVTNVLTLGGGNNSGAFNGVILDGYSVGANSTTVSAITALGVVALSKTGSGTQVFSGANAYSGKTKIEGGALSVASINSVSGGSATSNLGAPVTVATGTIDLGAATVTGRLIYTGTGETTDRVVNLAGATGGGTLDQSGTGLLKFTSHLTATGVGSKTLALQGSSTGVGEISGNIVDGSGTLSLAKAGTGTWTLSGTNTYSGQTVIDGGVLSVGTSQHLGAGSATNSLSIGNAGAGTLQITGTL
jgi:autotransporter-associated beta strand protein